jgi:hypothetical protein
MGPQNTQKQNFDPSAFFCGHQMIAAENWTVV